MIPAALPALSIWNAVRHAPFRGPWQSGDMYITSYEMQAIAAAWVSVELSGWPWLAALVQTAVLLPRFLRALPIGVLADTTDRRRLILGLAHGAGGGAIGAGWSGDGRGGRPLNAAARGRWAGSDSVSSLEEPCSRRRAAS